MVEREIKKLIWEGETRKDLESYLDSIQDGRQTPISAAKEIVEKALQRGADSK